MTRPTFRLVKRTVLTATAFAAIWALPAFGQERYRCAVDGCTITHDHTHRNSGSNSSSGNDSSAVNEYEAFRMWRDRTGRKDATYQDYLEAKNRGDVGRERDVEPPRTTRRPDAPPPDSRRAPDRVRPYQPAPRPGDRQRQPDRPVRTGPMHQDCRAHLNDYARFTEFPCIIERACKKCPTIMVMYANNYEYDKYNRLEKIEYRTATCPNCRYENDLSIRFRD